MEYIESHVVNIYIGVNDMQDKFFITTHCDRCGSQLKGVRTMSWFTDETICRECHEKELVIRRSLKADTKYEGCGYIPKIEGGKK